MESNLKDLEISVKNEDETSVRSETVSQSGKSKCSVNSSRKQSRGSVIQKNGSEEFRKSGNPFKFQENVDIFALRDVERKAKLKERERQRTLKVHEKTYGVDSRIKFRQAALLKDSDDENMDGNDQSLVVKEDPEFVIGVTKDRQTEKETLSEYITKKREMFLLQYSLDVKRNEMRKLEDIASAEEKKLELAEQYLEEDAAMFDEFLKENDKNAVDAMKIAENESKDRMAKVSEVKSLNTQLMQIKSEMNKYEEQLKEYKTYKIFLDRLIPDNIRAEREAASKARKEAKRKAKEEEVASRVVRANSESSSISSRRRSVTKKAIDLSSSRNEPIIDPQDLKIADYSSDDSEMDLYFKDPQELLNIFTELEESNLSLIQTCQETEESLDELKQIKQSTESKMKKDTDVLMQQIKKLETSIAMEQEKIEELEMKKKLFALSDVKVEDQDEFLERLHNKVEEVYKNCVSNTDAKMSTLDMLTGIENQLELLFEAIDQMPIEKVEIAQKAKDKERRLQMKEEKKEQQRLHQEINKLKALERVRAAPKKQTGRKIIGRSEPPQLQREDPALNDQRNREEEELMYFFT